MNTKDFSQREKEKKRQRPHCDLTSKTKGSKKMDRKTIGRSIRRIREEREYSREQLARKAGIHAQLIVRWEYGISSPTLLPLIAVADALDVSLDELVGRIR